MAFNARWIFMIDQIAQPRTTRPAPIDVEKATRGFTACHNMTAPTIRSDRAVTLAGTPTPALLNFESTTSAPSGAPVTTTLPQPFTFSLIIPSS